MGLADRFIEQGHQVRRLRMYAGKRNLVNLDLSRNGSRYGSCCTSRRATPSGCCAPACWNSAARSSRASSWSASRSAVTSSTARAARRRGRRDEVGAGYVVGCDGAHSQVRHELGLAFEGQPYAQDWLLADVVLDGAGSDDAVHLSSGRTACR